MILFGVVFVCFGLVLAFTICNVENANCFLIELVESRDIVLLYLFIYFSSFFLVYLKMRKFCGTVIDSYIDVGNYCERVDLYSK